MNRAPKGRQRRCPLAAFGRNKLCLFRGAQLFSIHFGAGRGFCRRFAAWGILVAEPGDPLRSTPGCVQAPLRGLERPVLQPPKPNQWSGFHKTAAVSSPPQTGGTQLVASGNSHTIPQFALERFQKQCSQKKLRFIRRLRYRSAFIMLWNPKRSRRSRNHRSLISWSVSGCTIHEVA